MTLVHLTSTVVLMLFQAPATGTAVLQGQVVRAGSAVAVPHAQIVVAKVGAQLGDYRSGDTDAGGRFTIRDLTAGTYRVYAQRDGYLQTEYGRRLAATAGIPVVLAEGQSVPITIEMTPPGVIAGQVVDDGRPARNVWVRALKATYFDGRATLRVVEYAQSDDRGEYRLFDLAPGFYIVSALSPERPRIQGDAVLFPAIPNNANQNRWEISLPLTPENLDARALMTEVHTAVYHPGTTDVTQALPIEVEAGSVTSGITLTIARARPFSVRGNLIMSDAPAVKVAAGLVPQHEGTAPPIRQVAVVNGAFEITGVPPGRYFLWGQAGDGPNGRLAAQPIEVVDRDLDGLTLSLNPGIAVKGRVTIDGGAPAPGPQLVVQLQAATPPLRGYSVLKLEPDGTFVVANVAPGEYRVRVFDTQRGSWIKEARYAGIDVSRSAIRVGGGATDGELEIHLSTKTGTIDALVADRSQRPIPGAVVVAVPDEPRRDRSANFRTGTADANGRVRLERVPPGEYTLFASVDIDAASWQDPNVLRMHQGRGEIVRLLEGGTATVRLRITP